jgi:ATP-binding cassette subfamily B protein
MTLGQIAPQFAFGSVSDLVHRGDTGAVDVRVASLVVVAFLTALSAYGFWIVGQRFTQGVLYLFRRRQFQRLSRLGIDYYDRELPGQVSARLVWDLDILRNFFENVALFAITQVSQIVLAFTAILVISPSVFPVVLVVAVVIIAMTAVNLPLNRRANETARDRLGHVTAKFEEDFLGRREIAQMAAGDRQETKFRASCWGLRAARRRVQLISNIFSAAMLAMGQITAVVVLYRSGNEVLAGAISIGSALTLRLLAETATAPFSVLGDQYSQVITAIVSWKRLDEPFTVPILPPLDDGAPACPPLDGDIVFDHVDFAYPTGPNTGRPNTGPPNTGRQVLSDVSFRVSPGRVTALVGVTGAGKSSVAKLVGRTYDPERGTVHIDGLDLRRLDLASYRARLGIVPQDAFVFRGTVASNVAYGRPDAARTEIEAAVRAVGAAEVLGLLPDGLDSAVEEDGTNLTTAQRQLIALARAWLTHPDILVLDEATSALDAPLERAVIAAVAALGCTTLMVTHREDVVLTADEVVVLSEGRVVQSGTPAELRNAGGHYDDLWGIATEDPADAG